MSDASSPAVTAVAPSPASPRCRPSSPRRRSAPRPATAVDSRRGTRCVPAAIPAHRRRHRHRAIAVPATWTSISTVPAVATDRTVNPTISAAQPVGTDAFPSLSVWVEPYRADATPTDITWCTSTSQPYTQGDFSGQRTWYTNCDGGLLYQDIVVGSGAFTITLSFAYMSRTMNRPSTRSPAPSSC